MTDIEVAVKLDDSLFWKLADIAEQFDMRVDQYLVEIASTSAKQKLLPIDDPVVTRWRTGMSDREIARELTMTNEAVHRRRRKFGLPANRKFRPEEERA